jgi:hypothetical protein
MQHDLAEPSDINTGILFLAENSKVAKSKLKTCSLLKTAMKFLIVGTESILSSLVLLSIP